MQNVCRTCMGDSVTLVNIFSDVRDPALEQPESNLSYILSECTNRSVRRDDCQPQFICLSCVHAAQAAFRFKRQCDRSYQRFCELQNQGLLEGNPDRDSHQAGHKEAPRAEESQSDSSPPRPGGINKRQMELSQSFSGSERKRNIYYVENNRFGCTHCPNNYKTKRGLNRHLLTHSSKPTHKCPYCRKAFWRRDTYIGHLLTHGISRPFFCKQCPRVFPDANHLKTHQREHDGATVVKSIPDDLNLETNKVVKENIDVIAKNLPLRETVHKNLCDLCPDSFILEDDLKFHKTLVHNINTTNPADNSKTFMLEPRRLDFSWETSTIEDFSIETCDDIPNSRHAESGFDQECVSGQDMQLKSIRNQRKLCNSGEKSFECLTCQVTHLSKPKHHCPICSKAFRLRFTLIRHLRTHKEVGYPCHQCSAIFIDPKQLKIHLREHEEKTVGDNDVDSDDNNMVNDFRGHQSLSNDSDNKNPAAESLNISRDWISESLDLSLESIGTDDSSIEKSEDNPILNKSGFEQETTLSGKDDSITKRNKLSSTEEKSDKCAYCHFTFKNTNVMQRHLNTHIMEPKYTCSFCSKPFWRNDCLTKHLCTHGLGERYSCDLCPAEFVEKYSYYRHRRNVHEKRRCSKEYKSKKAHENHENKRKCV